MIISRSYANKLVRQGKAVKDGSAKIDGKRYQVVKHLDQDRIDHYELKPGQLSVLKVKYV